VTWNLLKVLCFLSLSACGSTQVRVYVSEPEDGGLVRKQEDEILLYQDSKGYLCVSPDEAEALITVLETSKSDKE